MTSSPIFFPTVPDRNPRTECACQPVAFIRFCRVAPLGRFSSSRTCSVLLPWRAPDSVLAGLADLAPLAGFRSVAVVFPDLALADATRGARCAALGFVAGFGSRAAPEVVRVVCSALVDVILDSPLAVITAVTTWITPFAHRRKRIV